MYTIGQLSKKTGVTVRTLDYYDEIGLLSPKKRTTGGHRLYSEGDVQQLEQILALKYMGFTLDKTKTMLEGMNWQESIQAQLDMVYAEQARLNELKEALEGVQYALKWEKELDHTILFEMIKMFQAGKETIKERLEPYLEKEEFDYIMQLKKSQSHVSQEEWEALLLDVRANLDQPPDSAVAQQLAERWFDYVDQMFEGDSALIESMWGAIQAEKNSPMFYPMDEKVIQFIDQAKTFYQKRSEKHECNRSTEN